VTRPGETEIHDPGAAHENAAGADPDGDVVLIEGG
jgi:hypothetical protein